MTLFDLSPGPESDGSSVDGRRVCDWCGGPIPRRARRDAITCSQSCRQARHRFRRLGQGRPVADRPMRFAYLDPPYPGKAGYYADHPDFAGEVDHAELIGRTVEEYPDGWALSTSASALPEVLGLCPPGVRVAAWLRGERPTTSYGPLSAWEPVIYAGGRPILRTGSDRRVDALAYVSRPRLTDPNRVMGAKPAAFCYWLFDLLGALPGDELVDVFPGSGGVARAWRYYTEGAVGRVLDDGTVAAAGETSPGDGVDESGRGSIDVDVFERLRLGHSIDVGDVGREASPIEHGIAS